MKQHVVTRRILTILDYMIEHKLVESSEDWLSSLSYELKDFNKVKNNNEDFPLVVVCDFFEKYRINPLFVLNQEKWKQVYSDEGLQYEVLLLPKSEDALDAIAIGGNNHTAKEKEFLKRATAVIESNLSKENFGVHDLANELNMSRSNLYKKTKHLTGKSIVEVMMDIRLKKALSLVCNSDEKISIIGYKVGFNDQKYFRICFKKQYGIAPNVYRKRFIENNRMAELYWRCGVF